MIRKRREFWENRVWENRVGVDTPSSLLSRAPSGDPHPPLRHPSGAFRSRALAAVRRKRSALVDLQLARFPLSRPLQHVSQLVTDAPRADAGRLWQIAVNDCALHGGLVYVGQLGRVLR